MFGGGGGGADGAMANARGSSKGLPVVIRFRCTGPSPGAGDGAM